MTKLNKRLGKVLAELRRDAGLTQEEVAFECELHPTYISQLERGIKSPTVRTLFTVASVLGVKPSEILRRVEVRKK